MRRFTIIGGVNGVGKSTLAGALKAVLPDFGVLVDADKCGGRQAVRLIQECVSRGDDFTQETTLSGAKTASARAGTTFPRKRCGGALPSVLTIF